MSALTPKILWGIANTNATKVLVFDASGCAGGPFSVTLDLTTRYVSGDGTADDMCKHVADGLNAITIANGGTGNFTCTVSTTGTVTIARAAGTFDLLFTHASNTFGAVLGFSLAANRTGVTSAASNYQHQGGWYPERPMKSRTGLQTEHDVVSTRAKSGIRRSLELGSYTTRTEKIEALERAKVCINDADGAALVGSTNEALEIFWDHATAPNDFRFYPSVDVPATYWRAAIADDAWRRYHLDLTVDNRGGSGGAAKLRSAAYERYDVLLPMEAYVS